MFSLQAALRKLHQFVVSRILETSVAGMLLAVMCQAFAMVSSHQIVLCMIKFNSNS